MLLSYGMVDMDPHRHASLKTKPLFRAKPLITDSHRESGELVVSFCMPCYNGVAHLREAVASVLLQSIDKYELIIVDDASTDGTFELACELASQDDRIHVYLNVQNLGIVPNWNRCLELARGEWIKFIFQDDLLDPDCTAQLLDAARRQHCNFAFCEREILLEEGVDPQVSAFFQHNLLRFGDLFPDRVYVPAHELGRGFIAHLGQNFLGEPTSVLIHRSCIFRYGSFNPQLVHLCDLEYWIRMGCQEGLIYLPERLASFRVHPSGATSASLQSVHKKFRRLILDYVILYASFLLDPAYRPFRQSSSDAKWIIYGSFLSALRRKDAFLGQVEDPVTVAALTSTWKQTLSANPGIIWLQNREPLYRRVLRRLGLTRRLTGYSWLSQEEPAIEYKTIMENTVKFESQPT
ncbi:MAG TPA: glycosyltransferase [Gemmataceae bacterium]|nr:glycosyltransferase [Gemmataceae bacterium]